MAVAEARAVLAMARKEKNRALRANAMRILPPVLLVLSVVWAARAWVSEAPVWRQAGSTAAVAASLCMVAAPRLKIGARRRRAAAATLACFLTVGVFLGAGGIRYAYGTSGVLEMSYSVEPGVLSVGGNATVEGIALLKNVGGSTVRLMPAFDLKAWGPDGKGLTFHYEGCGTPSRTSYNDRVFIEMAPGAQRAQPLSFEVLWGNTTTVPPPVLRDHCMAFLFEKPGTYEVMAIFSSGSPLEYTTLPVWSGIVASPPVSLHAS